MNLIHRRYCRSSRWCGHLGQLLPWATADLPLDGADVLELGSGPGQTTDWLMQRAGRVTALEYDEHDATELAKRRPDVTVVNADARSMPLPDSTFDAVVCFTMLHHLPTAADQDRLFTEARRVLKPSGVFGGSDSRWGPLFAVAHLGDTMTLVRPDALRARLEVAGFEQVTVEARRHAFRFRAVAA